MIWILLFQKPEQKDSLAAGDRHHALHKDDEDNPYKIICAHPTFSLWNLNGYCYYAFLILKRSEGECPR
jgi:hypothetical protein